MTKQSTLLINKNTVFGNQQKCLILKFQPPSFEIMDLYKEKTDLVIVCCVMGYDRSAFTASEVTRDRNLKKSVILQIRIETTEFVIKRSSLRSQCCTMRHFGHHFDSFMKNCEFFRKANYPLLHFCKKKYQTWKNFSFRMIL